MASAWMGSRECVRAKLGSTGTPARSGDPSRWAATTAARHSGSPPAMAGPCLVQRICCTEAPALVNRAGSRPQRCGRSQQRGLCGGAIRDLPSRQLRWPFLGNSGQGMGLGMADGGMRGSAAGDLVTAGIWLCQHDSQVPVGSSTRNCRRHWGIFWQQGWQQKGEAWGAGPGDQPSSGHGRPTRGVLQLEQRP